MGKYRENINCKKPVKFLNKEKTVMCGNWLLFDYIPPKKIKKTLKQKIIDPKNKTVSGSYWNLGNHTLLIMFVMAVSWVVWISYQ